MKFKCPKCGTLIEGQPERCPSCGVKFKWKKPEEAKPNPDTSYPSDGLPSLL